VGGFVSAQPGLAWLREGSRIVAVRPGDVRAGLGRIVDVAQRDGRWFLIGESGTALLSSEPPAAKEGSARAPFNRRMISATSDGRRDAGCKATARKKCSDPTFGFLRRGAQKIPRSRARMRVFRACPVPDSRLLGAGLPRTNSRPPDVRNSLVAREKCREFRRIGLFLRKSVSKTSANSVSEEIPYATGQGINSREQGSDSAFSTGAGNLA
jgi:hypothetical protein